MITIFLFYKPAILISIDVILWYIRQQVLYNCVMEETKWNNVPLFVVFVLNFDNLLDISCNLDRITVDEVLTSINLTLVYNWYFVMLKIC